MLLIQLLFLRRHRLTQRICAAREDDYTNNIIKNLLGTLKSLMILCIISVAIAAIFLHCRYKKITAIVRILNESKERLFMRR